MLVVSFFFAFITLALAWPLPACVMVMCSTAAYFFALSVSPEAQSRQIHKGGRMQEKQCHVVSQLETLKKIVKLQTAGLPSVKGSLLAPPYTARNFLFKFSMPVFPPFFSGIHVGGGVSIGVC